ncbi:MAG: hypothetical protein AAGH40_01100 [Verrucomicrobiota bacterium]
MKSTICIFLLGATSLLAAIPTENLNPALLEIFEAIQSADKGVEGKEYTINLTLKVGTEKFLIFSDAYLLNEKGGSKYQIGKWIFRPEQTEVLKGKNGSLCKVRFKIEELRTESPYSQMPHVVAEIISIEVLND